jgi:hypothetical protein
MMLLPLLLLLMFSLRSYLSLPLVAAAAAAVPGNDVSNNMLLLLLSLRHYLSLPLVAAAAAPTLVAASLTDAAALFSRALACVKPPLNPADTLPVKFCTGACSSSSVMKQCIQ